MKRVCASQLFASGFACYLHEQSTLPHLFRIPLCLPPHPHKAPRRPAAPHKRTGRRLCFWFIAPQQAAGVRAQAGTARLSQRVYTVCAGVPLAPSGEMRFWECLEVEDRVAPVLGDLGGAGPHCRAGGSRPAGVRRQERRQGTGRGFERAWWAPAPCPQRPTLATGRCWRPCRPAR